MADIERPAAPMAVKWQQTRHRRDHPSGGGGGPGFGGSDPRRHRPGVAAYDAADGLTEPSDPIDVLGSDGRALTPEAQGVLDHLVDDIESLKWELDQSRHREAWLESMVDQHPTLPVACRRVLVREMERFLRHQEETGVSGALALFYLIDYESIHHRFGLNAAEEVLANVARLVAGSVRASDVVGHVGGAGLGVLMSPTSPDGAERRVAAVLRALQERTLRRGSVSLPQRVRAALRPLQPGDTVEEALIEVDAALRAQDS